LWIGQPHLIKKLEETFGDEVKKMRVYKSPGTPNAGIVQSEEESANFSETEKTYYRSGVGMLLFLVKHSRPDIANVTRELSKVMMNPTLYAFKELRRVIKYVLDTKNLGLKLCPNMTDKESEFVLKLYSDSD